MDPQKPGGYGPQAYPPQQPQQPPSAPYPPQPAGGPPQVYNQQYNLPQPFPSLPLQPKPKSRKKLWLVIGFAFALLIGGLLAFVLLSGDSPKPATSKGITRTYDTPAGLMPAFQAKDIKAGSFKLTSNYVSGGDFTRNGHFFVQDDRTHYEMLSDAGKVNELIKSLYLKADPKFAYDDITYGAARNFTYDFNALLGYQYLYDTNAGNAGGFIPSIEAAKADSKKAEANKLITMNEACHTALDGVKKKTGKNLTTTSLRFDSKVVGVRTEMTVSFASRQDIDRAVIAFFDNCFNFDQAGGETYKALVDALKENTTKSPTFAYWQEDGADLMTISPAGDNLALKSDLNFVFTELNAVSAQREGETSSFVEKRNAFGLAYSVCRVSPVVTTDVGFTYAFMPEDDKYKKPSEVDAGYLCTTLNVPPQYKAPISMTITYPGGIKSDAVGGVVDGFRSQHDLVFQAERFNLSNKRYPGPTEFNNLASNNMQSLTGVAQGLIKGKTLVFTSDPAGCVGDCKGYSLTYSPQANLKLERKTY